MFIYQSNGNLNPGIYDVDWKIFVEEFGFNDHRKLLIGGLELAIRELKMCGCKVMYIDGSFVSKKINPADYDACWDPSGVNYAYLKLKFPTLLDFRNERMYQKMKYKGEIFPATQIARPPKEIYMNFFQKDRDDNPKGIVKLTIS